MLLGGLKGHFQNMDRGWPQKVKGPLSSSVSFPFSKGQWSAHLQVDLFEPTLERLGFNSIFQLIQM